jgi:MYND finger protein
MLFELSDNPLFLQLFRDRFKFDFSELENKNKFRVKILKKSMKFEALFIYENLNEEENKKQDELHEHAKLWMKFCIWYSHIISSTLTKEDKSEILIWNPRISSVRGKMRRYLTFYRQCLTTKDEGETRCLQPANMRCSRCRKYYCSQDCQIQDWNFHRKECKFYMNIWNKLEKTLFIIPENLVKKSRDGMFIEEENNLHFVRLIKKSLHGFWDIKCFHGYLIGGDPLSKDISLSKLGRINKIKLSRENFKFVTYSSSTINFIYYKPSFSIYISFGIDFLFSRKTTKISLHLELFI